MQEMSSLLLEASKLLIVGMVFVFVFLALLTFVIRILAKLAPSAHIATGTAKRNVVRRHAKIGQNNKLNPSVVAAISAAVTQYRKQPEN